MTRVTVKLLGGLRDKDGNQSVDIETAGGITVKELERHLLGLGIDPESKVIIVTLNGKGLRQWPPDRQIIAEDDVAVFPHISGGQE